MDALSRLHTVATPLLARADRALAQFGAPDSHDIWPLLRRGRQLPSAALDGVAGWHPASLTARAEILLRQREPRAQVRAELTGLSTGSGWEGRAASAFHTQLRRAQNELTAVDASAEALHACLLDLSAWLEVGRERLARTLADILSSAEAVRLTIGPTRPGDFAAAAIGATILAGVDRFWADALEVAQQHHLHVDAASIPATADESTILRVTF